MDNKFDIDAALAGLKSGQDLMGKRIPIWFKSLLLDMAMRLSFNPVVPGPIYLNPFA